MTVTIKCKLYKLKSLNNLWVLVYLTGSYLGNQCPRAWMGVGFLSSLLNVTKSYTLDHKLAPNLYTCMVFVVCHRMCYCFVLLLFIVWG